MIKPNVEKTRKSEMNPSCTCKLHEIVFWNVIKININVASVNSPSAERATFIWKWTAAKVVVTAWSSVNMHNAIAFQGNVLRITGNNATENMNMKQVTQVVQNIQ